MTTAYRRIPYQVHAIRWTGDNYTEVRKFLLDNGIDADDIRNEEALSEYREFRFEQKRNEHIVDPGRWIAIDTDPRIPEGGRLADSWSDSEFRAEYEPAS